MPSSVMELIDGQSLEQKIEQSRAAQLVEILRIGYQIATGSGRRPRPGVDSPRHQAGQYPASKRHSAGADHRLWPGPGGRRRRIARDRRGRRNAAIHVARAGPGTERRCPLRPVQPGQRALCDGGRPVAIPRRIGRRRIAARVRRAAAADPRSAIPRLPPWLASIIDRLLAKDPEQRYQTAAEVQELLGQHLARAAASRCLAPLSGDLPVSLPMTSDWAFACWRWAGLVVLLLLGAIDRDAKRRA